MQGIVVIVKQAKQASYMLNKYIIAYIIIKKYK